LSFNWIFLGGRILDNYATSSWSTADTVVEREITVPTGKRWFILGGIAHNGDSVSRNIRVELFNENDKRLMMLLPSTSVGAGGDINILSSLSSNYIPGFPIVAKEGWYVKITWLAGSGGDASGNMESALVVLEVDL